MKKFFILLFLLCFSFSSVFAGGIIVPQGSRANGMGSAYVAVADDPVAIYYNPAGLTQLSDKGFSASYIYLAGKEKSNSSLANSLLPNTNDGDFLFNAMYNLVPGLPSYEPSQFDKNDFGFAGSCPEIIGYAKVKDITFALGSYVIAGGGGGKWESTVKDSIAGVDDIFAYQEYLYGIIVLNFSAAKKISQNISLGLGLNVLNMQSISKAEKRYDKSLASVLPVFLDSYKLFLEQNSSGYGYEGEAGVLYQPVKALRTGLTFRTGGNITAKGKAKAIRQGLAVLTYSDKTIESDYDQEFTYPMTIAAGASYYVTPKVLLSFQADFNDYSVMKEYYKYKDGQGELADVDRSMNWKDTYQVRIGGEYALNEKVCLRAGAQYDPSPCPSNQLSLLNMNQNNALTIGLGGGYTIGSVKLNIGWGFSLSDKQTKNGREYTYVMDLYQLGLIYTF